MSGGSENTTNRVYISSPEFGWLPAKVISSSKATVEVNGVQTEIPSQTQVEIIEYKDCTDIPFCEVSSAADGNRDIRGRSVITVNLNDYQDGVLPLQNVNEDGKLNQVNDMVDLAFLHEAAILYNLKARNAQGVPYTRTGDIVIAVNPYEWITDLYTEEKQSLYAEKLVFSSGSASIDPISEVDPHVYETSALAYRGLAVDSQNQSILVSGESGAGKTETVKILMSHLASIQSSGSDMHSTSKIVQRVLDSNPLLEAFGNAKTVRNDNSSRFGKFIQLQFDTEDPTHAAFAGKAVPSAVLAGSKCETYLLEKSRVVSHSEEERTYHIFYQLLASEDDVKGKFWDGLVGKTQESFSFVGYSDTNIIEGKSDQQRFQMTLDALYLIGVQEDKLVDLMRALCIVLQLGNLTFSKDPSNEENAIVTSVDELEKLSELMGVDKKIVEKSLLERTVSARNEVFKVPLNLEKAQDSCHALAKEIYSISFDWLVNTINHATCAEENYVENPSTDFRLIGLLDIFGFESFTINRFEQLCINYANEKLQQKFTLDIFRSVQQEYEFEGIELGEITYIDNSDVLNLIEGRMGLISVLNEECVRPKGNDTAFVNKIYAMNKDITCLYKDRLFRDYQFGIKHYAGKVEYDASGFVTKNMDNLPVDLLECRKMSTNSIVSCDEDWSSDQLRSPIKPNSRVLMKKQSSIASDTVWAKFRSQLNVLMANIGETRTRYIRCIKPNSMKKPRIMQHLSSIEQLRCAGVVAAVTISRSAFPNRLLHEQVFDRFMCLDTGFHRKSTPCSDPTEIMEDLEELLGRLLSCLDTVSSDDKVVRGFVCGKTRAYFRAGSLEHLENRRLSAFGSLSTDIQRIVRGYLVRSGYRRLRNTAIKMQAYARRKSARRSYLNLIEACLIIQCWSRQTYSRRLLITLKRNDSATKIQSQWRMVVTRQIFTTERFAAVKIQACIRGAIQRPLYQKALAEAIEEAKLENQLKTLQRKLEEAEQKRIEAEQRAAEGGGSKTIVVYKDGSEEHGSSPPSKSPELTVAQQTLMDESSKMLEYLRKEVFKLRSQNSQLRTDFELLKENNQRLMDANASAGASFASLNQHAKTLSKANAKLKSDVTKYKDLSHQLQMSQVELKEELKMKQGTYIAEVHSRLQYQKTMMKIVDMIQERCKDHRLVEDILHMSDDCESDYMTGPTGVDLTPVKRAQARTGQESLTGKLKSFLFS